MSVASCFLSRQMTRPTGFVVVLFLGLLALAGCGGGGDGGDVTLVSGTSRSQLYLSGNGSDELLSYGNANSVSGSAVPDRVVSGGSTALNGPRGIAVDMARNRIYVANTADNSILVFNNARTVTGDTVPSRTIAGATTTLNGPSALFLDLFHDRLYVANTGANAVVVFNNVSTASGDVAPTRTLAGVGTTLNAPHGVFVDVTRDKLYVSNGDGKILVFNSASDVAGSIPPGATLSGGLTMLSDPSGIFVDALSDRLYVANSGADTVLVFNAASRASGDVGPSRTISGPVSKLNQPRAVFIDIGTDRLYVANAGGDEILVFNNAGVINGAVAPDRSIELPAGTTPYGVFVDVTPMVVGSTADLDGEVDSNGVAVSVGGAPKVGDVEDFLTSTAYRQFFSFNLANIPSGTVISTATLRLYQANVTNSLYDSALGSVVVDHVSYGAVLDATAYATVALASAGTLSSDASTGYKSLNVGSLVQDDLSNGRSRSQYRLRFSLSDANLDFGNDYAQFTDAEDSCCAANKPPQLVITVRP